MDVVGAAMNTAARSDTSPLRVALNAGALRSPLTGIGQYVLHLGRHLRQRPELAMDFFYGRRFSAEAEAAPSRAGPLRTWVRRFVPHAYAIRRALEQRQFNRGRSAKTYDVYHEPNYLTLEFDGPKIITVHDLSWLRYPQMHPAERVRAMNRYFEPCLRSASLLLTDSVFVKNEIVEVFGTDPSLIHPIALGLDSAFRPLNAAQTHEVLSSHGLTHGEYYLCAGTLEPRKNVQATVAAYAALPQRVRDTHPLVLAGMKGWRTSSLERALEPLVRSGHARILGYLERGELAAVTAGALTLVYPSLYEGFGLPPLEAMGCGVPPITSNASSLPEVVGDSGIMVHPDDTDALREAMLSMACDPGLRACLSAKALTRAAQFSWERCAAETAAAYRRAAASTSR
ncbi:MAG TPA: glycosyltransferase family 1 protein [Ramlibacter sp.]|nr:glycosyltransferase family 1 protein [Ramlibacter sp.]